MMEIPFFNIVRLFAVVLLMLFSLIGLGIFFQKKIAYIKKLNLEHIFLSYFSGFTIFSTTSLLINWFFPNPYNMLFLFSILLFGLYVFLFSIKNIKREKVLIRKIDFLFLPLLFFLFIFLILYSLHSPSEWDEVAYHFPAMEEISAGSLTFPLLSNNPYNYFYKPFSVFYGNLPYASESVAAVGYYLSGNHQSIAHLLYTLTFFIFLFFVVLFLKRTYDTKLSTGLIVAIAITFHYGILILLGTGSIDVTTSIFQVLSCLLLFNIEKKDQLNYLPLSLLFLGSALAHKFTTVFMLPFYFLWLSFLIKKILNKEVIFKGLLFLFLGGGGWYLKNLVLFGNPIYPLYLGHREISEIEYAFLKNTLIDSLRSEISFEGFWLMIQNQYKDEKIFFLFLLIFTISLIFLKLNLKKKEILLLSTGFGLFLINYLFGSQLSRYVLFFPITIYLLASKIIDRSDILIIFILISSVFFQTTNLRTKDLWKARSQEISLLFFESNKDREKNCTEALINFCKKECKPNDEVLNLWDAYAAVYYEKNINFHLLKLQTDFNKIKLPENVKYVYTNEQWKREIIQNSDLHSDMLPKSRELFEASILKGSRLIFSKDNCFLFKI